MPIPEIDLDAELVWASAVSDELKTANQRLVGGVPAPESLAMADLSVAAGWASPPERPDLFRLSMMLVSGELRHSMDMLSAAIRIVSDLDARTIWAPGALCRASLESSSRCRYILRGGPKSVSGSAGRLARAGNELLEACERSDQMKLKLLLSDRETVFAKLTEVPELAADPFNKRWLREVRPGHGACIRMVVGDEQTAASSYSIVSAESHGDVLGLLVGADLTAPLGPGGIGDAYALRLQPAEAASKLAMAASCSLLALEAAHDWLGWDPTNQMVYLRRQVESEARAGRFCLPPP